MVEIAFEGRQPRTAAVHYKTGMHTGIETIDLSNKILLDKPDKLSLLELSC